MSLSQKDLQLERPFIINGSELVASVIYQAIKCKNYPTIPRQIGIIIERVRKLYLEDWERFSDDYYCKEFETYNELLTWLEDNIMTIPEIRELNLSEIEFEAGITVDDPKRATYAFTSRYSPAPPENEDFIDLDAYVRNLCHDLIRHRIVINFSTFPGARYHKEDNPQ